MGKEVGLLTNYPETKRNLKERVASKTEVGRTIAIQFHVDIKITASNDSRSYRQSSDKLLAIGFVLKHYVSDAINEIIRKYQSRELVDNNQCYNVRWMSHLNLQASFYE
jgi:hypothetical protein